MPLFLKIFIWDNSSQFNSSLRQALGPGALGGHGGSGWGGRWEGGSGWGRHVDPRPFHFNVWQNSLQKKKKKTHQKKRGHVRSIFILIEFFLELPDIFEICFLKDMLFWSQAYIEIILKISFRNSITYFIDIKLRVFI